MKYVPTRQGDVYSHKLDSNGKVVRKKLKPNLSTKGYLKVCLWCDGKKVSALVHRLVAKAFIQPDVGYRQVNHKNGNKLDNRAENLEWCDAKSNVQHAFESGLAKRTGSVFWLSQAKCWQGKLVHQGKTYTKNGKDKLQVQQWLGDKLAQLSK